MNQNSEFTLVGIPSTIITWLSMINLIKINPFMQFVVSLMSILWLSMQIYSFAKKHTTKKK